MPVDIRWLAEAAMHRIERRTLPAQRHEVLGALSALKLQLALARRRSAAQAQAAPAPGVSVADCDAMLAQHLAAQQALTEMRLWDNLSAKRQPLSAVLAQCVAWARQPAALLGHRLEDAQCGGAELAHIAHPPAVAGAAGPDVADTMVDVPRAHHLLLALFYAAIDGLGEPTRLVPCWQVQNGHVLLSLQAVARDDLPASGGASKNLRPPCLSDPHATISAEMLAALATTSDGAWQLLRGEATRSCHGHVLRCQVGGLAV